MVQAGEFLVRLALPVPPLISQVPHGRTWPTGENQKASLQRAALYPELKTKLSIG